MKFLSFWLLTVVVSSQSNGTVTRLKHAKRSAFRWGFQSRVGISGEESFEKLASGGWWQLKDLFDFCPQTLGEMIHFAERILNLPGWEVQPLTNDQNQRFEVACLGPMVASQICSLIIKISLRIIGA